MVEAALQSFGRLDTVILNAGLVGNCSLDGMPLEDFERILAVNLRGVVLGLRAAIPALRDSGLGSVVATASVSGLAGDPDLWAYNAAKGGVINFVRSAALNLASDNIRVNCVCPGPTRTGMSRATEESSPEVFEGIRRTVPLQRWGEAHEVASVICFLASPAASFVAGAIVPVDGGVMANTGMWPPPEKAWGRT
jgi:NAD(P)-dependent dehydrogenase (short-subunit alcohol dehydrogenase family)